MTPPVSLSWIPPGDLGTMMTLDVMAGLARAGASDPLTIQTVATILGSQRNRLPPSDSWGTARLLREWLARRFVFLADPVGVGVFGAPDEDIELVRTPAVMLAAIQRTGTAQGDCDDAATLAAALTTAAGLPTRFQVVGFTPDGPFTHVFAEARVRVGTVAAWVDFDVTRPAQNLPPIARSAAFNV